MRILIKKILLIIFLVLVSATSIKAMEFQKDNLTIGVYGNMYGDMFFSIIKPSSYDNNQTYTFGSSAFLGSSNFGVGLDYNNFNLVFEVGLSDILRKYYFKYSFNKDNKHFIQIGRDTNLAYYNFGQMANDLAGLSNYGNLDDERRLQIRYGAYGFQVALILPYLSDFQSEYVNDPFAMYNMNYNNIDYKLDYLNIPRLEMSYDFTSEKVDFKVFGSYSVYVYENRDLFENNNPVIHTGSIGIGILNKVDEKSFLHISTFYGYNLNMTGSLASDKINQATDIFSNNSYTLNLNDNNKFTIRNIHSFGIAGGFEYRHSKLLTAQGGIGYTFNHTDDYNVVDDRVGGYLNVLIHINQYFTIIPEVSIFHEMSDSEKDSEGYEGVIGIVLALKI